jgi:hypothetical protein
MAEAISWESRTMEMGENMLIGSCAKYYNFILIVSSMISLTKMHAEVIGSIYEERPKESPIEVYRKRTEITQYPKELEEWKNKEILIKAKELERLVCEWNIEN